MPVQARRELQKVMLRYVKNPEKMINNPECKQGIETDAEWLEQNFDLFKEYVTVTDIGFFNLSLVEIVDSLAPNQQAELLLAPESNTLDNEAIVRKILENRTGSPEGLEQFFEAFSNITLQRNVTHIQNQRIRDIMLNLTWTELGTRLEMFELRDYQRWFGLFLIPLIPSFQPEQLQRIPANISCESYAAIDSAFEKSSTCVPLPLSRGVRSNLKALRTRFTRCSIPASFVCKVTQMNEALICANVSSSQVEQSHSTDATSETICSYAVIEHACSSARNITANNLAMLLKCSANGSVEYPEVWNLLFGKASAVLDAALEEFSTMVGNMSSPSLSSALEAIGEIQIPRFDGAQLQNQTFIEKWFQTQIRPFLSTPSKNFLYCLSSKDFSCSSYHAIIRAFSARKTFMDQQAALTVFTHLIQPFLSKNDRSDPGCRSSSPDSRRWVQDNFGSFSEFPTLRDLQDLNPSISTEETLAVLTPTQIAQLTLSTGGLNDTRTIGRVFERLQEGDDLENVDQFYAELQSGEPLLDLEPAARDVAMNATFTIISNYFNVFGSVQWSHWFLGRLRPVLPSFHPQMLKQATDYLNCTNYHIVVKGLGRAFHKMPVQARRELQNVMLRYVKNPEKMINNPECKHGIETDAEWLEQNFGPFKYYLTYTEIQDLNLTHVRIVDLSAEQQALFLLEPTNLSNVTLVRDIFKNLAQSSDTQSMASFFDKFVTGASQQNLTVIESSIRDIIFNITLTIISPQLTVLNAEDVKVWFQVYLQLFLPSIDSNTFKIIPQDISCDSYQHIIKGCDNVFAQLSDSQKQYVYTFIRDFLSGHASSGVSCVDSVNDDRIWIEKNIGQFRTLASYIDLLSFKNDLKGVEVADLLTFSQIVELATIPTQLESSEDVTKIMTVISPEDLSSFFDGVSPAIQMHQANYKQEVTSALLQTALDKANLSSPSISDQDYVLWLDARLKPLLVNLSFNLVTPLFDTVKGRSCNISQYMFTLLDTLRLSLSQTTQDEIKNNIFLFLQGPTPIRCYERESFYIFLKNTFLNFGFPNLSMFLSLLPKEREAELLDTITPSELSQFLSQPNVIGNADICEIYSNYKKTPEFLENKDVPDDVKLKTLPCVWPLALKSKSRSDAHLWFDLRLKNYLPFLKKNLISSTQLKNASCFGFQKLVSVMGNNFTYNSTEFVKEDVYNSMRTYLIPDSGIKCYNASDAELNSKSWFVEYIGSFVTFVTAADLEAFIPSNEGGKFFEDEANLKLFNDSAIPENVKNAYVSLLFVYNPTYSVVRLPETLLCSSDIPSSAFTSLNEEDTVYLLGLLKKFCSGAVHPEVNAALVSNFKSFSTETLTILGQACGALSPAQILSVPGHVLVASLNTLGSVNTWNQEQAMTIIQTMSASGYQINTGSSLSSLGTLVLGVSSKTIINVPSSELLNISRDTTFVSNMLRAPPVVQEAFVQKIITVDQTPATVVKNVPDRLAPQIPLSSLLLTSETLDINQVNNKTWTQEQAAMFFELVSTSDFDTEELSPSILQGFTCTTVRKASKTKIKKLVRACRRRKGRSKVALTEPQLTCMYNHLKGSLTQNFTEYPSDLLLYFNANDVERTNCRSYLSAVGEADFSVPSSILNKPQQIFSEALRCLGIRGTYLSKDNVMVLGNLTCMLDSSYIQNSDPYILETLKSCKDFSESQVAAIETLLLSGKTPYGTVTTWDEETLQKLAPLPLCFTRNAWGHFKTKTKKRFLKSFMPKLRKSKTEKKKLKALFKEVSAHRVTRGVGCTVGNITGVTVQDPAFPFGYDLTQFDLCLDIPVLKDNLNSICEKVDDDGFQKIILRKLNEAYPAGVSDENVQVLGSVSRSATLDDISRWNITTIDTLSALMRTEDGAWEAAKSSAVITKYLNTSGNTLGTSELNAIDSNLCALDITTLKTITSESLSKAKPLNVASCSFEQKKVLYEISNISFSSYRANPTTYFNLMKNYLGGAPLADIQRLSTQNINIDISTFQSLDTNVINKLTVSEVQGLLGSGVADLKTFEKAPVVEAWINLQRQSDLDTLGLGLITTRVDPTSSPPVTNSTVANTSSITPAANTSSVTPAANTSSVTPAANTSSVTPAANTSSVTPAANTSSVTPAANTSSVTPAANSSSNTPATNSSASSTLAPGSSTISNQVTTTTKKPATTAANNTASQGGGFISLPSSLFMVVLLISLFQQHIV